MGNHGLFIAGKESPEAIGLLEEYGLLKKSLKKIPLAQKKPVYRVWIMCNENRERSPIVAKIIRDSIPKWLQTHFSIKSYGLTMAKNPLSRSWTSRDTGLRAHKPHKIPYYRAGKADLILVMTDRQMRIVQRKLKERGISDDKVRKVIKGEDIDIFIWNIFDRSRYRDFRSYIRASKDKILLPVVSLFRKKIERQIADANDYKLSDKLDSGISPLSSI